MFWEQYIATRTFQYAPPSITDVSVESYPAYPIISKNIILVLLLLYLFLDVQDLGNSSVSCVVPLCFRNGACILSSFCLRDAHSRPFLIYY